MKRLYVWLTVFILVFSLAGCGETNTQLHFHAATEPYDPTAGQFPQPPKGYLVTQDGAVPLRLGGYTWSYETGHGTGSTFHADQSIQPLPVDSMETVRIVPKNLWDGGLYYTGDPPHVIKYADKVTLDWQVTPDFVECVFWPVAHQSDSVKISCDKNSFMAHMGSHIYEITAGWLNDGSGFSGKASFYIHVIAEMEGEA